MPRHCLNSFWSLKLDFDNDFPDKSPKLYSTTTTVETAIDPTQFLVETPPFWPFSKYTDPSSTDPAIDGVVYAVNAKKQAAKKEVD